MLKVDYKIRDTNTGKWLDTSVFREAALRFMSKGYYCEYLAGTPEWIDYWKEELRRCVEGFAVIDKTNKIYKITGHHYAYLNYAQISLVKFSDDEDDEGDSLASKEISFPDFWDGDYNFFWSLDIARFGIASSKSATIDRYNEKKKWLDLNKQIKKELKNDVPDQEIITKLKEQRDEYAEKILGRLGLYVKPHPDYLDGGYHFVVGKSRRKGYSYKLAFICANTYNTVRNSLTLIGAYEKKFVEPTMQKATEYLNFINEYTAWSKNRLLDKRDIKMSGYIENIGGVNIEKGYKSVLDATRTFKDNPDAMRGVDAYFILLEESGAFDNLKNAYNAIIPSLTAGSKITGQICIIGCVCKGTKVYDASGKLVNIEDISKNTGIVGYAGTGVFKEEVTYVSEPKKKHCYRITTSNGKVIECSNDHPLMYSSNTPSMLYPNKKVAFKKAEDLRVGEQLISVNQVPIFGDKEIPYPRLVGLLIGDGYYGGSATSLAISDSGIKDFLDSLGVTYKILKQVGDYYYVNISGFSDLKRELGIYGDTKLKKHIPYDYHTYSAKTLSEIVGGYFDADSSINYNKKKNSYRISLVSVNLFLLEQVQDILLRFGIHANIFKRNHKPTILRSKVNDKVYDITTEYSYSLEFSNIADIIKFKKQFHFTDKKKQAILDTVNVNRKGRLQYDEVHFVDSLPGKGEIFKHTKLCNVRCEYIKSIEYIGEQDVYNLTANTSHTYITNTFISHNTSGDMYKGTVDYADMFYNPVAYGLMPFINTWDEGGENTTCGFFHPVTWNMEGFYDRQGNSDIEGATKWEMKRRQKILDNSSSPLLLQKHMQEFPLCPADAFSVSNVNVFPVTELRNQLNKVIANNLNQTKGTPVTLTYENGKVKAIPDIKKELQPIYNYKPKLDNLDGCPIIYEYPVDNAPRGLYKIGFDPYRQDMSSGVSLAAIYVVKGVHKGSQSKNCIVAEYVGRPNEADDVNRIAAMLAELYNTEIMHENEVTQVKNYFRRVGKLNLLASQPDRVISSNIKESKVARVYGCHMNAKLKDAGEKYLKDWLLEVQDYDEHGNPVTTIDTIYSIGVLEELIQYNRRDNFDRVSALFMCMMQVQEEALGKVYESKENNSRVSEMIALLNKRNNRML